MMDGGRIVALILLILLMSETGVQLFSQITGWEVTPPQHPSRDSSEDVMDHTDEHDDRADDKKQILITITSHCLPKLVCQLHSLENRDSLSDSERNLISLVGSASISGSPSKYSFAAHMGQLMRGVEGQGCHNFYPECPFSNQDVMQIAKRINFK